MEITIKRIPAEFAYAPHGIDLVGQFVFRANVKGDNTQIAVESPPTSNGKEIPQSFFELINIALDKVR